MLTEIGKNQTFSNWLLFSVHPVVQENKGLKTAYFTPYTLFYMHIGISDVSDAESEYTNDCI